MRNYKIMISSNRKRFLVDPKSNIHYYLDSIRNNSYFAKETREFKTVEEGSWYYLDGRYILCSEDVIHYIYEKDNKFKTVEKGSWYHLDGRYILCSEDVIRHIYE